MMKFTAKPQRFRKQSQPWDCPDITVILNARATESRETAQLSRFCPAFRPPYRSLSRKQSHQAHLQRLRTRCSWERCGECKLQTRSAALFRKSPPKSPEHGKSFWNGTVPLRLKADTGDSEPGTASRAQVAPQKIHGLPHCAGHGLRNLGVLGFSSRHPAVVHVRELHQLGLD